MGKFYGYFASAFGTLVFVFFLVALTVGTVTGLEYWLIAMFVSGLWACVRFGAADLRFAMGANCIGTRTMPYRWQNPSNPGRTTE